MTLEIKKPELQALIHDRLKNGVFNTVDELLMVAFNALDEKEHSTQSVNGVIEARRGTGLTDWRKMRGMARGEGSLTQALLEERAAEKKHDEALLESHRFMGHGGLGSG